MKNFPERLKSARIMKGYSLQDLADALENPVTKQALSKYENGMMKPDSAVLMELCKALDVRPDYFGRETTIELENVAFRKLQKLPAKEEDRVKQITIDILERYFELENLIGVQAEFSNPLKNLAIENSADVEQAANKLRVAWKLGTDPIKNVISLLEDNHVKVIELPFDLSFNGLSTFIKSREPVVVLNSNLNDHMDRKRFTTLHELGHLLMNLERFDEKQKEKFCHQFASAILIPEALLKKELGEKRERVILIELISLKEEFGASVQAILYRAKQLGIISENYYKSQVTWLSSKGYKQNEPWKLESKEEPTRFKQLLYRAVAEEIISTSKGAALANMKLADFRDELAGKTLK